MTEMEIKAHVQDAYFIEEELRSQGCTWSEPITQSDTIYKKSLHSPDIQEPIFRIRKAASKVILTLKVLSNDKNTATELELSVGDADTMEKILETIGFAPIAFLEKTRKTTLWKGYEICLDKVTGLGNFVEIEKLADNALHASEIYEDMKQLLLSLGITEKDFCKEKYYEMLMAPSVFKF